MNKNITNDLINKFRKKYNNKDNKKIESQIKNNSLYKALMDLQIVEVNKKKFTIELPSVKRENQGESFRCWIYAGINFLKYDISRKLNCDINSINLSYNYISFFDKLEKFNSIYETIIEENNPDLDSIFKVGITEWGYWSYFVEIIEKYGIMPYDIMPETVNSLNSKLLLSILNEKLKKDIFCILKYKKSKNTDELMILKEEMLFEVYSILSKIIGEPKLRFNYIYRDNKGDVKKITNISPIQFKNKILELNLRDYISVASFDTKDKKYYRKYENHYFQNIYKSSYPSYINVPINELKELAIKQLKDNIPVRFSSEIRKDIDLENGIMDCRLYQYNKFFQIISLTRKELLESKESSATHAMIFTGVNLENEIPTHWKVEDTRNVCENYNGSYVMNDNFFDKYVYAVYINKKYLNQKQREACDSSPIMVKIDDPF